MINVFLSIMIFKIVFWDVILFVFGKKLGCFCEVGILLVWGISLLGCGIIFLFFFIIIMIFVLVCVLVVLFLVCVWIGKLRIKVINNKL